MLCGQNQGCSDVLGYSNRQVLPETLQIHSISYFELILGVGLSETFHAANLLVGTHSVVQTYTV